MRVFTTHFVATDDEIDHLFPRWYPPRTVVDIRVRPNPFTGEPMELRWWRPEVIDAPRADRALLHEAKPLGPALSPAVDPFDDDSRALEQRIAPAIRALPHLWGMSTEDWMTALIEEVGASLAPPCRYVDPSESDVGVVQVVGQPTVL